MHIDICRSENTHILIQMRVVNPYPSQGKKNRMYHSFKQQVI